MNLTKRRRAELFWVAISLGLVACQLGAAPTAKQATQRISFRTIRPVAAHFKTQKEAAATERTLKDLGCATEIKQHDSHVDVAYECKFWRSLALEKSEADKWNKWLTSNGFAVVQNTPGKDHKETVKYHLKDWKTHHFHEPTTSKAHIEMFKMLGCEVKVSEHNGHEDVKVRCASSQTIGVPNHEEAHAWMQVLQKLGFATFHEH